MTSYLEDCAEAFLIVDTEISRTLCRSGNQLLRGLSPYDQALISGDLRTLDVKRGALVMSPDAAIDDIYFPESGLVILEEPIGGNNFVEIALVGNEGLIGWPALLGSRSGAHRAIVQGSGATLHAIATVSLLAACRSSNTLWVSLLNFVQAITVQMSRAIATHLKSPLDQRIARWLLMRHDRLVGDQIAVRHDEIADALNARRASVTHRLHVIEGERLISCRRGRIIILDRQGLKIFADSAFGIAEAEYRRLFGRFGKY